MSSQLAGLLFKDYRRRVLGLLLMHPDNRYHVREIARLTGTVAGTLHKELAKLAEVGLLRKEAVGNQVLYRADRDCPIFEELAGIIRKTSGLADVLADVLGDLADQIEVAFVFGSVAQGKEQTYSDVDVCVIGDASFKDVVKSLSRCQEHIGREINPVVMSRDVFVAKYRKKDRFVRRILQEAKIFLIGKDHDLGELIKNRAT